MEFGACPTESFMFTKLGDRQCPLRALVKVEAMVAPRHITIPTVLVKHLLPTGLWKSQVLSSRRNFDGWAWNLNETKWAHVVHQLAKQPLLQLPKTSEVGYGMFVTFNRIKGRVTQNRN